MIMKNNINMEETKLKPFDIVKVKKHETWHYGMITETCGCEADVEWFEKKTGLYNAWWEKEELTVVNNAVAIIANQMAHPFGGNEEQGDLLVGIKNDTEQ